MELSKVSTEVKLKIADLALTHIKKVIADPEVKTDGDNFDYWNSYKLENGEQVDYNIYCGDDVGEFNLEGQFEYGDPSEWSFGLSLYGVNPPTENNPYCDIDMDDSEYIFTYQNGKVDWENK